MQEGNNESGLLLLGAVLTKCFLSSNSPFMGLVELRVLLMVYLMTWKPIEKATWKQSTTITCKCTLFSRATECPWNYLCLFLLSLIHLFFSFLYAWHYLHWFYSSLLIPVLFFILFLSTPLLQQPDISWTPGLRRKWLFVWSSKQRTMTVFLPSPWLTHTHIFPTLSLSLICVCLSLSSRCDWYQCQEASVLQLEQTASVYGFCPG